MKTTTISVFHANCNDASNMNGFYLYLCVLFSFCFFYFSASRFIWICLSSFFLFSLACIRLPLISTNSVDPILLFFLRLVHSLYSHTLKNRELLCEWKLKFEMTFEMNKNKHFVSFSISKKWNVCAWNVKKKKYAEKKLQWPHMNSD